MRCAAEEREVGNDVQFGVLASVKRLKSGGRWRRRGVAELGYGEFGHDFSRADYSNKKNNEVGISKSRRRAKIRCGIAGPVRHVAKPVAGLIYSGIFPHSFLCECDE